MKTKKQIRKCIAHMHTISTAERYVLCMNDFELFCYYYLSHYFTAYMAVYQRVLIQILSHARIGCKQQRALRRVMADEYAGLVAMRGHVRGMVLAEPRGFGKSTRMSLAYPLWCALYLKKRCIVLIAANQDNAEEHLSCIRDELQYNERIIADFGQQRIRGLRWQSRSLHLSVGSAIFARGYGSSLRGIRHQQHRPDLVILDDVIRSGDGGEYIHTKNYRWIKQVLFPLGTEVFILMINTISHNHDVISRLLLEIESRQLQQWIGIRISALDVHGCSIWPEQWRTTVLADKKREMGEQLFSCEYLNKPQALQGLLFYESFFCYYDKTLVYSDMDYVIAIDPSVGRGDASAMVCVGMKRHERGEYAGKQYIYIIDIFAQSCGSDELIEHIIQWNILYKPIRIVFEEVAFQAIYREHIMYKAQQRGISLPIIGISPHGISKTMRIAALAPYVENGILLFNYAHRALIEQMLAYPHGMHDDLVDALAYAVKDMKTLQQSIVPFVFSTRY